MKFRSLFYSFTALALAALAGCREARYPAPVEPQPGDLIVQIEHRVGNEPLDFTRQFTIESGEAVEFSKFKYYLSNFVFIRDDGSEFVVPKAESFFLIEHGIDASMKLQFADVPPGNYTGLRFLVGIDSLTSVLPPNQRTGVLDEAGAGGDMYWTWNSGYIFLKMEGIKLPEESAFQYHIGGFGGYDAPTINNIKEVELTVPADPARVTGVGQPTLVLAADVLEFFKNPTTIVINDEPFAHFSPSSTKVAANYADMFFIDRVQNP